MGALVHEEIQRIIDRVLTVSPACNRFTVLSTLAPRSHPLTCLASPWLASLALYSPVVRTGQAHRTLTGHLGPVTSLQFDETHIVSGSLDKSIKIWDLRMGTPLETLRYEFPVTALQFDSRKIIACTGENGVEVWNRTSRRHERLVVNGHTKPAERMRFVDRYLVSGGRDGVAKVWAL